MINIVRQMSSHRISRAALDKEVMTEESTGRCDSTVTGKTVQAGRL
jgi:hypothetical protein